MRNILIALLNLKAYKKFYYKYVIIISSLFLLITLFISYFFTLKELHQKKLIESISANFLLTFEEIDEKINFETKDEWKIHNLFKNTEETNNSFHEISFFDFEIKYNDQIFFSNALANDYGSIISGNNDNFFSENDITEYYLKNKNKEILIGVFPKKENEILISQKLLKKFNLNDSVLNKEIRLIKKEDKNKISPFLKITGIIKSGYYDLEGHNMRFSPIIVGGNEFDINAEVSKIYRYNLKNYLEKDEFENLSEVQTVYYDAFFLLDIIENIKQMIVITVRLFSLVTIALCFGIFMILVLISFELMKIFAKNSGILRVCGIKNNSLYTIFIIQLLIVFLISTFFSLIFNFIILKLIGILIYKMYLLKIEVTFLLLFNSFIFSLLILSVLILVLVSAAYKKNNKKTIRELLVLR